MRTSRFLVMAIALFLLVTVILMWIPSAIWAVDYICILFAALFVVWFFSNEPGKPGGRKR